ncbi:putative ATP-dependent DNA helicase HFM1, partial [Zancudomyces culisetae]
MMGRAGRPQYDEFGVAVLMTTHQDKSKYEAVFEKGEILESTLHHNIEFYLGAEICMGEIASKTAAMTWMKSSFLYQRLLKNPTHYKILAPGTVDPEDFENELSRYLDLKIDELLRYGVIKVDEYGSISPTGKAMGRFYLKLSTISMITNLKEAPNQRYILQQLSKAAEFSDHRLLQGEKGVLDLVNQNSELKYTVGESDLSTVGGGGTGAVREISDKVFLLIQCYLLGIVIRDAAEAASLNREMAKIIITSKRVIKAFVEHYVVKRDCIGIKACLDINRYLNSGCFDARNTSGSPKILAQIPNLGTKYSQILFDSGIRSIAALKQTPPSTIENLLKRNPPFGFHVIDSVNSFPVPSIAISKSKTNRNELDLFVGVANYEKVAQSKKSLLLSWISVLVYSNTNTLLIYCRAPVSKLRHPQKLTIDLSIPSHQFQSIQVFSSSDNHDQSYGYTPSQSASPDTHRKLLTLQHYFKK